MALRRCFIAGGLAAFLFAPSHGLVTAPVARHRVRPRSSLSDSADREHNQLPIFYVSELPLPGETKIANIIEPRYRRMIKEHEEIGEKAAKVRRRDWRIYMTMTHIYPQACSYGRQGPRDQEATVAGLG